MSNQTIADVAVQSDATDTALANALAKPRIISITKKQSLIRYFSMATQFLTWPIAYIFFHSLYKVTINDRQNLKKIVSPFILISNHVASYDSFLFRLVLGFWASHLPLRFMAVDKFDYKHLNFLTRIGVIKALYALFGVFVIVPGKGVEENLKVASDIIMDGGNVVIYPEGKIVKKEGVSEFKRGAAVLVQKTNVPVLPVSFRISGEEGAVKKRLTVNIGEPLWIPENMDEGNITQVFYNSIVNLYNK